MRKDVTIRPERDADREAILDLVLHSFKDGTDYSDGAEEIALVQELWQSEYYLPELSFVAEVDGHMVGHLMFSRFPLSETEAGGHTLDTTKELVILTPVAVQADCLRQGIGSAMLTLGIEKVRQAGFKGILVEGNPAVYHKVGFRRSSELDIYPVGEWLTENPDCMMAQECYPGAMAGISGYVVYDMYKSLT